MRGVVLVVCVFVQYIKREGRFSCLVCRVNEVDKKRKHFKTSSGRVVRVVVVGFLVFGGVFLPGNRFFSVVFYSFP